jgi:hypothetical protein
MFLDIFLHVSREYCQPALILKYLLHRHAFLMLNCQLVLSHYTIVNSQKENKN